MSPGKKLHLDWCILSGVVILTLAQASAALAQTAPGSSPTRVQSVDNACTRFTAGSVIQQPPALFSEDGVLNVRFSYQTTTDRVGRQLFCFMTPDGLENPTLHVNPGDTLNITVTNNTPTNPVGEFVMELYNPPNCGDTTQKTNSTGMTGGSMNIHYHGTNTSPACHEDNVVKTLINSGHTFQYSVHFPTNEPPGLYWYHPHVHGLAELAVQGGGLGALVVDGINNVQPAVAGLRDRILVIRDQPLKAPMAESPGGTEGIPQNDLTVNYVPLDTTVQLPVPPPPALPVTTYTPAVVHMENGERQFWRVCNCTSDAPLDLQVRFDGKAQIMQLVGIDAVPVDSQDGTESGQLIPVTHFRIPPAGRVEFLVDAPSSTVKLAQLVAQLINSGPIGDDLPTRPLLTIRTVAEDVDEPSFDDRVAPFTGLNTSLKRFGGITSVTPSVTRTVYFDELEDGTAFFINASECVTAAGAKCDSQPYPINTKFDNNNAPAIITTQGSVEKWIVQNRARENHELHQHQIHFKVLSQDNFEMNGSQQAPGIDGQFLDMIEVPYCNNPNPTGQGGCPAPFPWPQVQLLMDFRGPDIGDFVFHCHILGHEDRGMMAIERVKPKEE
jgi:FtsP/CotA-like multicopper oxidase with cupredoxin domain